jgi:hypothetical protein
VLVGSLAASQTEQRAEEVTTADRFRQPPADGIGVGDLLDQVGARSGLRIGHGFLPSKVSVSITLEDILTGPNPCRVDGRIPLWGFLR